MEQNIGYIKSIQITGLWGKQDVLWDLRPDVNILSGINGSGKSTILKVIYEMLCTGICENDFSEGYSVQLKNVSIKLENTGEIYTEHVIASSIAEAEKVANSLKNVLGIWCVKEKEYFVSSSNFVWDALCHFDLISNFDRLLNDFESVQKLSDKRVKTELDWQLYQLQKQYLDYQVNIGNRIIKLLSSEDAYSKEKAAVISAKKTLFQDRMDSLFGATKKKIDRFKNEIQFLSGKEILSPYQLSAGEKQILVILLTVLVQDEEPCILLMDEPEISLHIEWQKNLINMIRELNPNIQILLATHSPAVIMNGWLDAVTEVSDISSTYTK